tara:strand:- start:334 stop:483 length:150 start_codon:yes stop_codon:yes gene_type:complete
LNKKPTPGDLKVWEEFTSSKEKIENKDRYLDQKKNLYKKLEKLICMDYL